MPSDDGVQNPAAAAAPMVASDGDGVVSPVAPVTDGSSNDSAMPIVTNDGPVDPVASDVVVAPTMPSATVSSAASSETTSVATPETTEPQTVNPVVLSATPLTPVENVPATTVQESRNEIYAEIARKISDAHNILIALSSDPSVDEMAAAIGLSLYLDRLGKRATAIYSGSTPNALEFLKPEETFESTADALQDFVIALDKEKADHLRYKLDGDYVKIYITPYRTRIAEEDLDFSYGDFNVDLVLALDVMNGVDLDSALREHGRIMHSAAVINITTGNPGKFGEIEWSDKRASSVSEMIAGMLYGVSSKIKIEKEEATAFLTGIVAATNRFSNASTTPTTMQIASKLMESGANQQLVSQNITPDVENEMFSMLGGPTNKPKAEKDPTKLEIDHGDEIEADENKVVNDEIKEKDSTLLDELKAAEASLAQAGAEVTPDESREPIRIDSNSNSSSDSSSEVKMPESQTILETKEASENQELPLPTLTATEPIAETPNEAAPDTAVSDKVTQNTTATDAKNNDAMQASSSIENGVMPEVVDGTKNEEGARTEGEASYINETPEKVIQPSADFDAGLAGDQTETEKYGQMLQDAIKDSTNLATANAPAVASVPEINGVPEINYMPMPGEEVLPPPPTPPIDTNVNTEVPDVTAIPSLPEVQPIVPAAPVVEPDATPLGANPAMQDQVYNQQAVDPTAFKIPGM